MKSITEAGDLKGKRVLVRVDWSDGDDFRIKASQQTIDYLINAGAKVILATHVDGNAPDLKQFVPEGVELLPNLRADKREEENSDEFAKSLAEQADIYVNEAFAVSHRAHASLVGVPKFLPSYVGFEFEKEVKALSKAFNPPHPFLIILGGAKWETKLPLVDKFVDIAEKILIAGAMAVRVPETILANPKVLLPVGDISALDADDQVLAQIKDLVADAKFILWNGPLGKYEDGRKDGTLKLAKTLAESGKEVVVGGADTLLAIKELNILDKFSFVSTGGGAMLAFLATGTLPAIEALNN